MRIRGTPSPVDFQTHIGKLNRLARDAVFDKSTGIDALVDYCAQQCFLVAQRSGQAA